MNNDDIRPIILIGGGGHCESVISILKALKLPIKGIIDVPDRVGEETLGIPIIGADADIPLFTAQYDFLITVGFIKSPTLRCSLYQQVNELGGKLPKIIAPTANVAYAADIAAGSIVMQQAVVNAGARVGVNAIINTGSIVEHDVVIGAHTHISTGAIVNGNCRIGDKVFVGSGAIVIQGVDISDNVIIGAGSVVTRNINQPGVYVGCPAKKISI